MQTRVVRAVWKAKRRRWRWSVGELVFQGSNGFSKTVIGETQRREMGGFGRTQLKRGNMDWVHEIL